MALTPTRRTYPQLGSQSTVEDADLFATYRGVGPLKKLLASVLKTYVLTNSGAASFILSFANAVSRTLLQRFESQPANLLDFYAVSDGANYTPALNRACAAKFAVYVPEGTYPLLDKVTMATAGNFIFGDGVAKSIFTVTNSTFNMSATAVIECPSTASENHAGLHDIGVVCTQPSTSTRASFNQYPYIFKARNVARLMIGNIRITGGYDGLDLRDNTGGLMGGRWELGCINESVTGGGATSGSAALDFWHIDTIHVWPFGFADATRLVAWQDGNTIATRIGRVDGLQIKDLSTFNARVIQENTSGVGAFGTISALQLDGRNARLEMANGRIAVGAVYSSSDLSGDFALQIAGGHINIGAMWATSSGGGSQPLVDVGGAYCSIGTGTFLVATSVPAAEVDGGYFSIGTGNVIGISNTARSAPVFLQTSGRMSIGNVLFDGIGTGSGPGVTFTVDDFGNYVNPGTLGGWGLVLPTAPTGGYQGSYGQIVPVTRTIAAADPLPILSTDEYVVVTGNTNFGTIQTTRAGHKLTLRFTGTPTAINNPGIANYSGAQNINVEAGLVLDLIMTANGWEERGRTLSTTAVGWTTYTPAVSGVVGSLTATATLNARRNVDGMADFNLVVGCSNIGTSVAGWNVDLPFAVEYTEVFMGGNVTAGNVCQARVPATSTTLAIASFNNAAPGTTGDSVVISGRYRVNV